MTQRGNRRQNVFFCDDDYRAYAERLAEGCAGFGVAVWGYCLMPNYVHLILAPRDEAGLRAALGEAQRRYTRRVNFREGWRGHLWQGRFASVPMDEAHLLACARYVELNPVRAKLAAEAQAWPWSSARAHLAGRDDDLVQAAPLLDLVGDWAAFLDEGLGADGLRRDKGYRVINKLPFAKTMADIAKSQAPHVDASAKHRHIRNIRVFRE